MRAATQTAINAALQTAWSGGLPTLVFANQSTPVTAGAPWAKATLIFGDDNPAAVGALLLRTMVLLTVQVFMPPDSGTRAAMLVADALKTCFPIGGYLQYDSGDNIAYAMVQSGPNGPTPAGMRDSWDQYNVTTTFRVDETNAENALLLDVSAGVRLRIG